MCLNKRIVHTQEKKQMIRNEQSWLRKLFNVVLNLTLRFWRASVSVLDLYDTNYNDSRKDIDEDNGNAFANAFFFPKSDIYNYI